MILGCGKLSGLSLSRVVPGVCSSVISGMCVLLLFVAFTGRAAGGAEPVVSFTRDIRPILSDRCFICHGPDGKARKAGRPEYAPNRRPY